MYPHLALQLIFTLILLTLPASHTSDNNDQFSTCSNLYSCGENIDGVRYPFWGDHRPQICGLQGFQLTCSQDNSFPTINMNNQRFSVLGIQESSHQMTLAHLHIDVGEKFCKQGSLYTTDLNDTLFAYNQDDVGFVNVYYNCPSDIYTNSSSYSEVTRCSRNGLNTNSTFTLDVVPGLERCTSNITVPVFNSAILELKKNISMELGSVEKRVMPHLMKLKDVLKQGFSVDYKIDETYCSACENSGGLCWSGTDEANKTCLCKDGANASVCTTANKEQSPPTISPLPPQGVARNDSTIDGGTRSHSGVKIGIGSKKSINLGLKMGIGAAASAMLLMCFMIYCLRKYLSNILLAFGKTKSDKDVEAFIRQYGFSTPKRYKYSTIKSITNSFKHELGKGGYGNVYKGKLSDGRVVAVKVLNVSKGKGEEFINEVASIGRTSHVNVVTLLGFCYEGKRRALIYEFMPNGSLEKFIYGKISPIGGQHLGFENLYNIALGIARGLEYLHQGCNTRIVHFDIKPHNILLDEDFCPKISDFGLAKLYTRKESIISMMEARGTIGYIAPEVFSRNFGQVSHKSDVYSYGMMIIEMVGGRKNADAGAIHTSEIYFPHWIYKHIELNEELNLVSAMTIEENEIARKMIIVGLWCIQTDPSQRPSISKVIEMLEGSIAALEIPPKPYLCSPRAGSYS